jgi:hypothetical protein
MANVTLPPDYVKTAAKDWPARFKGFTGYIWNDGTVRTIRIAFVEKTTKDGTPETSQFNSLIKVDHKGWKLITQKDAIDFQHRQESLNPSQVTSIYISADRPAEIALGALTWTPDAQELQQLDKGNSAAIYQTAQPPVIDGNGGDAAWQNATQITLSHVLRSAAKPTNQTTAKVLFDTNNLYLLVTAPFTDRGKMKMNVNEFDAAVWEDEDIEVILYPGIDARKYAQFMITPKGVRADLAMLFDQAADGFALQYKDWNPQWTGAAKIGKTSWTAEISIPWKAVDNGVQPSLMQLQIGRNDTSAGQYTLWAPSATKPASSFGVVTLNANGGGSVTAPAIQFWRTPDKKYFFRSSILADQDLNGLTVKTYFCPPRSAPEVYTKTFATTGKSADIEFPVDSDKLLNGEYLAAVDFIPGNKSLHAQGVSYFFNQYLPSEVKFSDTVFNPEPKNLTWNAGNFAPQAGDVISLEKDATARTVKTAQYLAQKMDGVYGFTPKVALGQKGRIHLSINPAYVKEKTASDSIEAYTLDVTPTSISVTGAGEAGLYYGVVTLEQLVHGPKMPDAPMRSLSIADWPSYPTRVVATYVQFHLKKYNGHNSGLQLDRYKHWIENVVAGQKFNTLILTWGDQINYPSLPEIHDKDNFSPQEISELFDFARDHFIDASPGVLFGAHSYSWARHYPDLVEPGWNNQQLDATLPGTYSLMQKVFGDLIDIAGPKAHYFMNANDEWWAGSRTQEKYFYKGKTRQDLFADYLTKAHQFIAGKGKQMVMMTDMLHPKHNGGPPWNLSDIADKLSKDIVMASWSYNNDFFTKLGFAQTWTMNNGFKGDTQRPDPADTGYGQIYYPLFQSLFNQTDQNRTLGFSYLTTLTTANYAWNKETKPVLPTNDWVLQKMPAYLGSLSYKPNPAAGNVLTPVAIPHSATISQWPQIQAIKTVGEIPVSPGAALASSKTNVKIPLPAGTRASSFYILGAVYPGSKEDVNKLQQAYKTDARSMPYGLIVGEYRINYADGTSSEYNARLGRSISLFQYTPAASRYGAELRAVVPLSDNQETALAQFEMVNPHPEKIVTSFEVTGNYDDAPILVSGITVRSVK